MALIEGGTFFPPNHLPFLDNFIKVIFWFPPEAKAFDNLRTFANKIGEKRCSIVRRDIPQPSKKGPKNIEFFKNPLKFVKENAIDCAHEFITNFSTLRDEVYAELVKADEVKGVKWKRFPGLNKLMQGFRRGELTIFSGRTGQGKTTFLSEYSLDLCEQGVSTLWGNFELKNRRLTTGIIPSMASRVKLL